MRVLFIVEPDFLFLHVGVRRVILFYFNKLVTSGVKVDFGTPRLGEIFLGEVSFQVATEKAHPELEKAYWSSKTRDFDNSATHHSTNKVVQVKWTERKATLEEYDTNFVTAPWVCDLGVPPLPRMIGIIYDLVPNLLACGCLCFPTYIDIYKFAEQHDLGFRYYLANAERVICISDSTRSDFSAMYKTVKNIPSVITDIPFECDSNKFFASDNVTNSVLLVNVLDWRKNLKRIKEVLLLSAQHVSFNLRVIGKERIDLNEVIDFFEILSDMGIHVEWFRDASDDMLVSQYSQASVLLFPSIYEGLGLPVLEAQALGLPVITSNTSSCIEVNMNKKLSFHPSDVTGMSEALINVLNDNIQIKRGEELRATLNTFLGQKNILNVFNLS